MGTVMRPALWKGCSDGSEQTIEEEDLYRYTRYRWLSNDSRNRADRYLRFDIEALLAVAVKAVGSQARQCTKILKCVEGQSNKALLLTMNNGAEVVARLPNPSAGPGYLVIASEVATRHFLHEFLEIATPPIYAWSSDPSNAVGSPYIIEGKASGTQLGSLWQDLPQAIKLGIISQIVDIERKLASISFSKHRYLYYKANLERNGIIAEPLTLDLLENDGCGTNIESSKLQNFSLGPLTAAEHWAGCRAQMNLDRGPWSSTLEYIRTLGCNEIQYLQSYAKPRMNFSRSMEEPESPSDALSLVKRYMELTPFLVPSKSEATVWKTLSHPDLHLDNIFINTITGVITSIIDWQSTSVSELFWQPSWPLMVTVNRLSEDDQLVEDVSCIESPTGYSRPSAELLALYNRLTHSHNPKHWAASRVEHGDVLREPVSLITGAWEREDIFSFRHALISVVANWATIMPPSLECPIKFTELELKLHGEELDAVESVGTIMRELEDSQSIPIGGMVPQEEYDAARKVSDHFKNWFVSKAEDEEQKQFYPKLWPYDGT